MWDKLKHELGLVKAETKYVMVHKFIGGKIDIRSVVVPCSCTGFTIDRDKQTITITFLPGKVPKSLRREGKTSYPVSKNTIVVSVVNNKEQIDTFNFTATVKDK